MMLFSRKTKAGKCIYIVCLCYICAPKHLNPDLFTEDEIMDLIDLSINRQWKNIIWSKLEGENEGMKAFYDSFAL